MRGECEDATDMLIPEYCIRSRPQELYVDRTIRQF